jgi:sec-independent protein translocase protein TatA
MRIGTPELIIFLVIILILFGVGRVSRIGSELGTAVREFRRGIQDDEADEGAEEDNKDDGKS